MVIINGVGVQLRARSAVFFGRVRRTRTYALQCRRFSDDATTGLFMHMGEGSRKRACLSNNRHWHWCVLSARRLLLLLARS
jgi:hypothetical protein